MRTIIKRKGVRHEEHVQQFKVISVPLNLFWTWDKPLYSLNLIKMDKMDGKTLVKKAKN